MAFFVCIYNFPVSLCPIRPIFKLEKACFFLKRHVINRNVLLSFTLFIVDLRILRLSFNSSQVFNRHISACIGSSDSVRGDPCPQHSADSKDIKILFLCSIKLQLSKKCVPVTAYSYML